MNVTSAQNSLYHDARSDFFRRFFSLGVDYDAYVRTGKEQHQARWHEHEDAVQLTADQKSLIASFTREMNVLVMSGTWCGDCARQGPMLRAIEKESKKINLRFLDNRANPELQKELRINGAERVPVVVTLSEDFFEISRFGERHLSVYRRKAKTELGPACEIGLGTTGELSEEVAEWVEHFERLQLMLRLAPMLRARYGD